MPCLFIYFSWIFSGLYEAMDVELVTEGISEDEILRLNDNIEVSKAWIIIFSFFFCVEFSVLEVFDDEIGELIIFSAVLLVEWICLFYGGSKRKNFSRIWTLKYVSVSSSIYFSQFRILIIHSSCCQNWVLNWSFIV